MLSFEVMGALALAVLWVNTLLIAADALLRWRRLRARGAALRKARLAGALVCAEVGDGQGEGGAMASVVITQTGRAITSAGPRRITWMDRDIEGTWYGGRVTTSKGELALCAGPSVQLWCPPVSEQGDVDAFEAAWPRASTFKGATRAITRRLKQGDRVWLVFAPAGDAVGDAATGERAVALVASEDPEHTVARASRPLGAVIALALLGATLVTVLALWPPVFGTVSTLGGAAGLAFFLGIQPLGTAARDAARLPDERPVGGLWQEVSRVS